MSGIPAGGQESIQAPSALKQVPSLLPGTQQPSASPSASLFTQPFSQYSAPSARFRTTKDGTQGLPGHHEATRDCFRMLTFTESGMGCIWTRSMPQRWGLLSMLATDWGEESEPPGGATQGLNTAVTTRVGNSSTAPGLHLHACHLEVLRLSLGSAASGCAPVFPKGSISPVGMMARWISPGNVGPTVHSGAGSDPSKARCPLSSCGLCHVKSFVQVHGDNLGVSYEAANRSLWQTLPPTLL